MVSAQKPPAPPPSPAPAPSPSPTPGRSAPPLSPSPQPIQPDDDRVLFLRGRVAISDGSAIPNDMLVERICNQRVRQQVYAAPGGDFNMQLGSRADSYLDASGDRSSPFGVANNNDGLMGIPRRDLTNCELRASAAGFHSNTVSLVGFNPYDSSVDVGAIVMSKAVKVKGGTLNAAAYKAPANARKAYEKGLEAEKSGKLAEARRDFEEAVAVYPTFAIAWYQLGTVLQKQSENDAARTAFSKATSSDPKFLPPYFSLTSMAYEAKNWEDVLTFTNYLLRRDPLNHVDVSGYVVDLDAMNYADIYFYNAFANFRLDRLEDAEKSALKAEQHIDLNARIPKVHLLLAEIFARKKDYAMAISEIRRYLELVPQAKESDRLRERLVEFERLNAAGSASRDN
jgi:tetratricopeptide (TPR) repeat protein